MKIIITGSGGCVSTPRPCCNCNVCVEAREKGFPYARTGCSLYIDEANILIDTPEDISYAINNVGIEEIDYILYSHCDPDHTMGIRLVEQLKMDWLGNSIGYKNSNPIKIISLPTVLNDIEKQGTRYGAVLKYYREKGLVTTRGARNITVRDICIEMIPVDHTEHVAIFAVSYKGKKLIYAPCDVKPFPEADIFYNSDVLIIGNTIVGDVLKDGFVLKKDNPLRDELFVMEEVEEIMERYNIGQVVVTHLEEDWGKSYDDYKNLQKKYKDIAFAYDGMTIEL